MIGFVGRVLRRRFTTCPSTNTASPLGDSVEQKELSVGVTSRRCRIDTEMIPDGKLLLILQAYCNEQGIVRPQNLPKRQDFVTFDRVDASGSIVQVQLFAIKLKNPDTCILVSKPVVHPGNSSSATEHDMNSTFYDSHPINLSAIARLLSSHAAHYAMAPV